MKRNRIMAPYIGIIFCISLILSGGNNLRAQVQGEEDIEIYNKAKEYYKAHEFKECLTLMGVLREKYPESTKADDALWYTGRCQEKLGNEPAAIESFREILSLPYKSNRYSEAALDLGEIYYAQKDYDKVLTVLTEFRKLIVNNNDRIEIHLLLGKTYYMKGLKSKSDAKKAHFIEAETLYTQILAIEPEEKYKKEALYWLGKTYYRLLVSADTDNDFAHYKSLARTTLREGEENNVGDVYSKFDYYQTKVKEVNALQFHIDITSLGGTNFMVMEPGARIDVDMDMDIFMGLHHRLTFFTDFSHTNFSRKTFNFLPLEKDAGDIRLVQLTETITTGLEWTAGLKTPFLSELTASGEFEYAEDPEDMYISAGMDEKISYEFSPFVTAGLNLEGKYKTFPDYLINNRKLDYIQMGTGPECELTFSEIISLHMYYEFMYKGYLDSKYDTATGDPATENKQYFTHTTGTDLRLAPWEDISFILGYDFTYNITQNYNTIISGNPAPQYIEGYFDYYEHDMSIRIYATLFDKVKSSLKAGYALRNFLNYEARDNTNTFTGEMRNDSYIYVSGSIIIFLVQQSDTNNIDLSIVIEGGLDNKQSNMTYENSIDTNYNSIELFTGINFSYN